MRLVQALDRLHRVKLVPFQQTATITAMGLSLEQCEQAAWAVSADGRPFRGAAAINAALAAALGVDLPLRVYNMPGIRRLQDRLYVLVANNRHRLPGDVPYCDQHPSECE